jgi:uncharacterized protein (TIGR03086 family)
VTAALDGAVELLERSLGYTRGTLADVRPDLLHRPTPCSRWQLRDLLAHMEDALDAFTEAAAGHVVVDPVPPTGTRVEALREKACALLGAWTAARPSAVRVGDTELDSPVLVATAALEITVHGWDVAQATGRRTPIPPDLARGLLAIAHAVVQPTDRGSRFGAPHPVNFDTPPELRLLAWTGRTPYSAGDWRTGQPGTNHREPARRPEVAS